MNKIAGKENAADALPKHLRENTIVDLCDEVGQARRRDRAGAQLQTQGKRVHEEVHTMNSANKLPDDSSDSAGQKHDNNIFDEQSVVFDKRDQPAP